MLETVNIFCQYTIEIKVFTDTSMLTHSFSSRWGMWKS